jgi:LacI family transcriptional regulator
VIGFDDLTEAAYFTPSLTTITHPLRELGIMAVKALLAQIDGTDLQQDVQAITLQTELVIRQSTPSLF